MPKKVHYHLIIGDKGDKIFLDVFSPDDITYTFDAKNGALLAIIDSV